MKTVFGNHSTFTASIIGFSELFQKKYVDALDLKAKEYIQFAVDDSDRMQHLIDDLLDYSCVRRTKTDKVAVDFEYILDDVEKNLSALIVQYDAKIPINCSLPVISATKHKITRVFQYLISNVIKIHKEHVSPKITINCSDKNSHWLFMVSDNRIGIPDDNFNEIFDIFKRLNSNYEDPGTGIGLTICKKIVEQHGGKIWVESQVNQGSTFYFTIKK